MTTYELEVTYNNSVFNALSSERGGLHADIFSSSENLLHLRVSVKVKQSEFTHYWFKHIRPGDQLRFTYKIANDGAVANIKDIESIPQNRTPQNLPSGMRLGFDYLRLDGSQVRLSHPEGGGFIFVLGNIPLNHARTFIMAGNEQEEWFWQLDDLHPDNAITLKVIETDWNNAYPRVTQRSENAIVHETE